MAINSKCKDFVTIFITKIIRMFSYGIIGVIFYQTLKFKDINADDASLLQAFIIFGDIFISLLLTTKADSFGRKNSLFIGAMLKIATGYLFATSKNFIVLVFCGIFGIITVTGAEIGPFLAIQQSVLTDLVHRMTYEKSRIDYYISKTFGYFNFFGYTFQALGGLCAGYYLSTHSQSAFQQMQSTEKLMMFYSLAALINAILYTTLVSKNVQPQESQEKPLLNCMGLKSRSVPTVRLLSALFAMDAFGGAFIAQSFASYYFYEKFHLDFKQLGTLLAICNFVGGLSGILSAKIVQKIGAMKTMIFTHLPSNVFLIMIPFSQTVEQAMLWLILRHCISQMDVPARQAYVVSVVDSEQRSAANGITNLVRSVGVSFGLYILSYFSNRDPTSIYFSLPFILAGGIKIFYDLTLALLFLRQKGQNKRPQKFQEISELTVQNDTFDSIQHEEDN